MAPTVTLEKEITFMRRFVLCVLASSLVLTGCEGARNNTSWSDREQDAEVIPALTPATSADSSGVAADSAAAAKSEH